MYFFQHPDILDIFVVAYVASRCTWKPSSIVFQQRNHLLKVRILSDLKGSFAPANSTSQKTSAINDATCQR